jgi:electron transport complex protein RnfD
MKPPAHLAPAPHLHEGPTTRALMLTAAACLAPAVAWGALVLGPAALLVLAAAVGASLLAELAIAGLAWGRWTLADGSALLTGLLVGCSLPASVPLFIPIVAASFAVAVVKLTFGGLGRNWMNPALGGRLFVTFSWPALLAAGGQPGSGWLRVSPGLTDGSLLGGSGTLGVVSTGLLALGGAYLLARRIAAWEIPAAFTAAFALTMWVFAGLPAGEGLFRGDLPAALASGSFALAALFMATDPVTSPKGRAARLAFGAGCGALSFLLRTYGGRPEGPFLAVPFMNMFVPLLNRLERPGGKGER